METALLEFYQEAREAFEDHRYEEAQRIFLKLVERGCNFADIMNMLGTICFSRNDYHGARVYFLKALEINPKYTEACLNLAVTLNETGEYQSAEAAFVKARRASLVDQGAMDPYVKGRLANLHADIGEIYHGLGLHAEAVSDAVLRILHHLHPV